MEGLLLHPGVGIPSGKRFFGATEVQMFGKLEQSGSEQSVFLFLRNPEDVVWGSRGMIVINGDAGIRRLDIDG